MKPLSCKPQPIINQIEFFTIHWIQYMKKIFRMAQLCLGFVLPLRPGLSIVIKLSPKFRVVLI